MRTTLVPGFISKLVDIWWSGADRCGLLWILGVSLSSSKLADILLTYSGQVRTAGYLADIYFNFGPNSYHNVSLRPLDKINENCRIPTKWRSDKLKYYGVSGNNLNLSENYLTKQSQVLEVNGKFILTY